MAEYERQALSGFAAAEDWGKRVGIALKPEIERVLGVLAGYTAKGIEGGEKGAGAGLFRQVEEAVHWVKSLGIACEARGGVKVTGAA